MVHNLSFPPHALFLRRITSVSHFFVLGIDVINLTNIIAVIIIIIIYLLLLLV